MMFKKTLKNNITRYQFLGITVLKISKKPDEKKIYLLGIRVYKQDSSLQHTLGHIQGELKNVQKKLGDLQIKVDTAHAIAATHQATFLPYKNKFEGKELVIVGSGGSLNSYTPVKNALHISLNRSYRFDKIDFDFLFLQDIGGLQDDIESINKYRADKCTKFYGYVVKWGCSIPEKDAIAANAKRYYSGGNNTKFYPDIAISPLPDYGSIAFPALAFALYTNPKKIYLVGCDASKGYFFSKDENPKFNDADNDNDIFLGWRTFKAFAQTFYPDTEIISINPVGLKGMFTDVYQNDFETPASTQK